MFFVHLINLFKHITPEMWAALAASPLVSIALNKAKKWFAIKGERLTVFLLGALSFVGAVLTLMATAASMAPDMVGAQTTAVIAGALAFYHFISKPLSNFLAEAEALNETKPAAEKTPATDDYLDSLGPKPPSPSFDV